MGTDLAFWAVDFEFTAQAGEPVHPRCMVATQVGTGVTLRLWEDQLQALSAAPFPVDATAVMVAYMAAAELACFRALGWPLPVYIFDCFVEFRRITNGRPPSAGNGLLGALAYFGIPGIAATEKESMRQLVLRDPPYYTPAEQVAILDYCETDVTALVNLLPHLEPYYAR